MLDNIWSESEVTVVPLDSIVVAPGQTMTKCVYCPQDHPIPMAGGFGLVNSTLYIQSSYPENWEHAETWESPNDFERAGWCGTVYSTHPSATTQWGLHITCRDTSSMDVSSLKMVAEEADLQWEGQGWIEAKSECPEEYPIPWTGGFKNTAGSKIQLLASYPEGWDTSAWPAVETGWRWKLRGFNGTNDQRAVSTLLICGKTGHFNADDDVKHYSDSGGAMSFLELECPPDHPIPLAGGARTSSTATYVTTSRPLGWHNVASWGDGVAPAWRANADNYDQNPQTVTASAVCRAPRPGETLP